MLLEKMLRQFWRCTDMECSGDDAFVSEAFQFKEKLTDRKIILSGMRIEYDFVEPGAPGVLSFDMWDLRDDELNPGYWPTGRLISLEPTKNGFIAHTGDDKGKTTYTFKKTKINPIERVLLRTTNRAGESAE